MQRRHVIRSCASCLIQLLLQCARVLESLGHTVEDRYPEALDDPETVIHYVTTVSCHVARGLESWGQKLGVVVGPEDVEPLTWELAQRGREVPATTLLASTEYVHRLGRRLADFWESGFDLLLTPTQADPPPRIGTLASNPENPLAPFMASSPYGAYTLPFNLSGQPAISLPGGFTRGDGSWPQGLPLGVQLIARQGEERLLFSVARQWEEAAPWADHVPPIFG